MKIPTMVLRTMALAAAVALSFAASAQSQIWNEDFEDDDENYNLSDDYEDEQDEVKEASFEEAFAAELESVHGDLGPESHRNKGRRRKGR